MQRLSFTRTPGRAIVYLLVVALVGVLIGVWVGKAVAATPAQQQQVQVQQRPAHCATTKRGSCTVTKKGKRFHRRFEAGRLGHNNGLRPGAVFEKPRRARKVIVRRIDRMLKAARAAGTTREAAGGRIRARGIYHQMFTGDDDSCSVAEGPREWSAMSGDVFIDCNQGWARDEIDATTVANTLIVTACAGGVVVATLARGTAALKFFGVTFQMTSCIGSAMLIADN